MTDWLQRTELLIGADGINKLKCANVLVVGMGGEFCCRVFMPRWNWTDDDC